MQWSGVTTAHASTVGNGATGGNIVLMLVMRWTANGLRWGGKQGHEKDKRIISDWFK